MKAHGNISQIMNYLDEERIEELGKFYHIDKSNHKITGAFILKSFVRSVLLGRPISLRSMEEMVNYSPDLSALLKSSDKSKSRMDHSSLGRRLEKTESKYYQDIYEDLVLKYELMFKNSVQEKLCRFDSTIITLAGRMIKDGLKIGGKNTDSQIKITVNLSNQIPRNTRFCITQSEANEDVALVKAINEAKLDEDNILLFDRGISGAKTYQDFSQREIKFITRLKLNRKYLLVKENLNPTSQQPDETGLLITSDEIINLYSAKKLINCNLRLVKATNKEGTQIWFLTNLFDSKPEEIAKMYKSRWDIEVFFKFVKQHLQFKNFISHNKNGMSIYIYCILISAILFTIFKISNQLKGFKIPLLRFTMLLEKEIIKDLIILSGGNLKLVEHRL